MHTTPAAITVQVHDCDEWAEGTPVDGETLGWLLGVLAPRDKALGAAAPVSTGDGPAEVGMAVAEVVVVVVLERGAGASDGDVDGPVDAVDEALLPSARQVAASIDAFRP